MNLKERALKGGAFLAVRQALGMCLSVLGVLLVTRVIGPSQYGLYAVGAGIVTALYTFGTWGLDVYLLRKPDNPLEKELNQAFTLLLLIAVVSVGTLVIFGSLIAEFVKMPGLTELLIFLSLSVPLNLLSLPAVAKLDRNLDFKRVAANELISQTAMYGIAVPLAIDGKGAWAPATGFITQQLMLFILSCRGAKYWPSCCWDTSLIKKMLGYGLGYSSSIWIWQLRSLVNPIIVGRIAGAEAVGFVAMSIRFAEVLSFAKSATWRIAMAALANICEDRNRLRRSIEDAMRLQALAVGIPLAGFALLGPILIPLLLGPKWSPAFHVFPFVALGYLANAMFNLHSSVLYLLGKSVQVSIFHVIHIAIFASSAVVLVSYLGFIGYGWAEMVALLSYLAIHVYLAKEVGTPSYEPAVIWFASATGALLLSSVGTSISYVGLLFVLVPLMFTKERETLLAYSRVVLQRNNL